MAETGDDSEKTEEPTQKKLDDARKKGDVPKSQEVTSWFMMLAATMVLMIFSKDMAGSLAVTLKGIMANAHDIPVDHGAGVTRFAYLVAVAALGALAIPFILIMISAIASNLLQHGPILSTEPITPKLSKISPMAGIKRLFSTMSLVNFAKSLAKLVLVAAIMTAIIWPDRDMLDTLIQLDPMAILDVTLGLSGKILFGVMALLTLIAALDFAYQRHQWWEKQRMTLKEVRDEYKQQEGDPTVKAKLRQVRQERSRQRMMAAVPDASVVITNPTHYSIALKYEDGMGAPICLAKGVDDIALKIREVATEHDIPLVENPPLARALHATVEIEEEISPEHYKAVAEVIGYVMQLRQKNGANAKK